MRRISAVRRFLILLTVLTLSALSLVSCGKTEPAGDGTVTLRLAAMKGPTAMGMVKLLSDRESDPTYDFTLCGSADEITPRLISGQLDVAAVPANLAAVLYRKTEGEIAVLAVNTLGVLSVVERGDTVRTVSDLRGMTILATGKGSTPEYALRYILTENGLDPDRDVTLEWKSEPAEAVALLNQGKATVAMLPQPYVTVATSSVSGLRTALDLTEEWDRLDAGSSLVTGTVVVRRDFAEAHPDLIRTFLAEYEASTEYVNTHPSEAAALMEHFGIVKASVAEQAIPGCHIVFRSGQALKETLGGYLAVLYGQNPAAVGDKLPDDGLYLDLTR